MHDEHHEDQGTADRPLHPPPPGDEDIGRERQEGPRRLRTLTDPPRV